jgi:hypothetical protein
MIVFHVWMYSISIKYDTWMVYMSIRERTKESSMRSSKYSLTLGIL